MSTESLFAHARDLLAGGKIAEAEPVLRQLAGMLPRDAGIQAMLGHALGRLGRLAEAREHLALSVSLEPRLLQAWRELAQMALASQDYAGADAASFSAFSLQPSDPWLHFLRGHVLALCGRFADADAHFKAAATAEPTRQARTELVFDAIARQQPQTALYHARAATSATPSSARAWQGMGEACIALSQLGDAASAYCRAVELAPKDAKLLGRAAQVLEQTHADAELLIRLRRELLQAQPDSGLALADLARALVISRHWEELHDVLPRLLAADPGNLLANWLGFLLPPAAVPADDAAVQAFRARWVDGLSWVEAQDVSAPNMATQVPAALDSVSNFYLAYTGQTDLALHQRFAVQVRRLVLAAGASQLQEAQPRRIERRPRRIGVLSSHLHHGAVGRAWNEALLAIPGPELELHVFHTGAGDDQEIARLRERAQTFHSGPKDFGQWCAALRDTELDVLIFLAVGLDAAVQALASLRHAPVQLATWGHPVTTGMASIDYFLSSELAEADDADTHYSERLVRLPHLGGYFARPAATVAPYRAPSSGHFLCAQSLVKLHAGHDVPFARILQACGGSSLTLLTHATREADLGRLRQRLLPVLHAHGVAPDRVHLRPMLDGAAYLAELAAADVLLDSLDFSGGLTSLDGFWHEKPIVTLPGALMRGRQTMAMLRRMELPELIAGDGHDYVRIATELVRSTTWHAEVSAKIAAHKHRLFEDSEVCAALCTFLGTVQPPSGGTERDDATVAPA